MRNYVIRRVFLMIPTLFLITVVVFLMVRLIPGDAVQQLALQMGARSTGEQVDVEAIREMLGMDLPMHVQYGQWMWALLMGMAMSATTMRMLRTTMLDVLRQDYVRTAWSKGLRERVVVVRHAVRNALIPVVTIISGQIPIMIGGAVIMEQIFNLPGMGRLFLDSINRRDYPFVSGLNVLLAGFGLVLILLTDLSYAYLDPRIRYR